MEPNLPKVKRISSNAIISSLMSGSGRINTAIAFQILEKRKIADKHLILRRLLENVNSDKQTRLEAALALGRSQHRNKVKILLRQLEEGDEHAQFGALRALGLKGGADDFPAIRDFRSKARPGFVKQEASYAENLLAYRLNLKEGTIKFPRNRSILKPGKEAFPINLRKSKLDKEKIRKIKNGFQSQSIAVQTKNSLVFSARCGKENVLLLLGEEFDKYQSLEWLLAKKSIPVLIGNQEFCPDSYSPTCHIFSHPSRNRGEITLFGLNTRGTVIYSGSANVDKSKLDFQLKSINVPNHFGLQIDGSFDAGKKTLAFSKAISSPRVFRSKQQKNPKRDS